MLQKGQELNRVRNTEQMMKRDGMNTTQRKEHRKTNEQQKQWRESNEERKREMDQKHREMRNTREETRART